MDNAMDQGTAVEIRTLTEAEIHGLIGPTEVLAGGARGVRRFRGR
jgi:hypothetical protein